MPYLVSIGVTALFIVFVINAVNLIDGIDGLASGLSAVACIFYAIVCLRNGLYTYSALAAATLGTLLPFFFFNVFGDALKHRKIFMGDTGALTVGLFLSVMCISICHIGMPAGQANLPGQHAPVHRRRRPLDYRQYASDTPHPCPREESGRQTLPVSNPSTIGQELIRSRTVIT